MKKQKIIKIILISVAIACLIYPIIHALVPLVDGIKNLSACAERAATDPWYADNYKYNLAYYGEIITQSAFALSLILIAFGILVYFLVREIKDYKLMFAADYKRACEAKKSERLAKKREKLQKQLEELPRD